MLSNSNHKKNLFSENSESWLCWFLKTGEGNHQWNLHQIRIKMIFFIIISWMEPVLSLVSGDINMNHGWTERHTKKGNPIAIKWGFCKMVMLMRKKQINDNIFPFIAYIDKKKSQIPSKSVLWLVPIMRAVNVMGGWILIRSQYYVMPLPAPHYPQYHRCCIIIILSVIMAILYWKNILSDANISTWCSQYH